MKGGKKKKKKWCCCCCYLRVFFFFELIFVLFIWEIFLKRSLIGWVYWGLNTYVFNILFEDIQFELRELKKSKLLVNLDWVKFYLKKKKIGLNLNN